MPVGRLDKDTSGLLLFSNDVRLANAITDPSSHAEKEYLVELDRPLHPDDVSAMSEGMVLEDGTSLLPAKVLRTSIPEKVSVTITEGKNRQLRRMMAQLEYTVISLVRIRIGALRLGGMPVGQAKELSAGEVALLERPPRSKKKGRS